MNIGSIFFFFGHLKISPSIVLEPKRTHEDNNEDVNLLANEDSRAQRSPRRR
jgi:hypothetical protein